MSLPREEEDKVKFKIITNHSETSIHSDFNIWKFFYTGAEKRYMCDFSYFLITFANHHVYMSTANRTAIFTTYSLFYYLCVTGNKWEITFQNTISGP